MRQCRWRGEWVDWSTCEGLISSKVFTLDLLLERMFNLRIFQSLSPSLFILSLPPKLVWINQIPRHLHVVICSVADLSKITKSPRKISQFFLHMNTFTWKVKFLLCHAVAFCRDRENWAKFYYSQSISKVFTWNKLGGKTYTMSGRVKMIEGNRGGKGFGGKVVDRRFNASAKWGKHERKYWAAEEKKDTERRNILNAEFEITSAWLPPTNGFCAIRRYIRDVIFFEVIIFSLGLEAVTEAICHTGHLLDKVIYFRAVIGNLSCMAPPSPSLPFIHFPQLGFELATLHF